MRNRATMRRSWESATARSIRVSQWALACTCVALIGYGCAPAKDPKTVESVVRGQAAPAYVLDASTGEAIAAHEFYEAIRVNRVVYVAERHDVAVDHAAQNAILRRLYEYDSSLAIGMEMFQAPFQQALDRWTDGLLDENALRAETEYDMRWGFDFAFYRPMLEFARARAIPVIALNAPREITRKVAASGLDSLTKKERRGLPKLNLTDADHRALFDASFSAADHGMASGSEEATELMDRYYTAQVIWDDTMASNVAQTVAGPDASRRMVVFAGRVHVESGVGVPSRAATRGAEPYVTVIPVTKDEAKAQLKLAPDVRIADYFWVVKD